MNENRQEEKVIAMTKEEHEAAHRSTQNGKAASQVALDEMKTATTKEEFEQLVKEGKPFQLAAKNSITIASMDTTQPPIIQIKGDFQEVNFLFFYALAAIMNNAKKYGMTTEELRKLFHEGVEQAYMLADL